MVVPRAIRAALFAVILFQGSPAVAFEKDKLSVSGEIRERYENRVGASFGNPNQTNVDQNNQSFVGSRIRLNVGYAVATDVRFFVQMQDLRLFGAERGALANSENVDLHQGYFEIEDVLLDGLHVRARVGRRSSLASTGCWATLGGRMSVGPLMGCD